MAFLLLREGHSGTYIKKEKPSKYSLPETPRCSSKKHRKGGTRRIIFLFAENRLWEILSQFSPPIALIPGYSLDEFM
jgi:hypothetical protein